MRLRAWSGVWVGLGWVGGDGGFRSAVDVVGVGDGDGGTGVDDRARWDGNPGNIHGARLGLRSWRLSWSTGQSTVVGREGREPAPRKGL